MTDRMRGGFEYEYRNDPVFRQLTDMIYEQMKAGVFTPSDVRQALLAATVRLEMESHRGPEIAFPPVPAP